MYFYHVSNSYRCWCGVLCIMAMWIPEHYQELISPPSGRLINILPWSKCDSVNGSSTSAEVTQDNGLAFSTISVLMMTVNTSSYVSLAPPIVFLIHRFTDLTILSNEPPHHGALSRLKIHSTFFSARYYLTTGLFIKSAICLEADWKILPLSEAIINGNPLLAVHLRKRLRKASAVRSGTMSRCTAPVEIFCRNGKFQV